MPWNHSGRLAEYSRIKRDEIQNTFMSAKIKKRKKKARVSIPSDNI
jgi:hypothetical protein